MDKKPFNPNQSYLLMAGGLILLATSFIGGEPKWTTIEIFKVVVCVVLVGLSTFRLIRKK